MNQKKSLESNFDKAAMVTRAKFIAFCWFPRTTIRQLLISATRKIFLQTAGPLIPAVEGPGLS